MTESEFHSRTAGARGLSLLFAIVAALLFGPIFFSRHRSSFASNAAETDGDWTYVDLSLIHI